MKFATIALATTLALTLTGNAAARPLQQPAQVQPIPIPAAHAKARATCPLDKPLACRAALIHALEAVAWQKGAREHTEAMTVQAITRDAIAWAAAKYHVSAADMTAVSNCESHLWPFATNGQYKGAWQLGSMHLSDPIFAVVPWQDAYAQASHVARFVKRYGWGQWQCRPDGRLGW